MGESGCLRCALEQMNLRKERMRSGPRKVDLEPMLAEYDGSVRTEDFPVDDPDGLLRSLLEHSVVRPLKVRGGARGPRVEIRVSPELVVVLDKRTFDALRQVEHNAGIMRKMMKNIAGLFSF